MEKKQKGSGSSSEWWVAREKNPSEGKEAVNSASNFIIMCKHCNLLSLSVFIVSITAVVVVTDGNIKRQWGSTCRFIGWPAACWDPFRVLVSRRRANVDERAVICWCCCCYVCKLQYFLLSCAHLAAAGRLLHRRGA